MQTVDILGLILGSSVATSFINHLLQAKTSKAKLEAIIQGYYGDTIKSMQSRIDSLRTEINELNTSVESYKKQEVDWEAKRKGFINQIKHLETLNKKMNETVKKLTLDNTKYKKERDQMNKEIESLKKQVQLLNNSK